jgi:uncharacterized membrane protein YccC
MRMTAAFRASRRSPFLQVAKSAAATAGAWVVAGLVVPGPPPVFAAIAALLVVQPSLNQSFAKAVERTVGVIVGVVVAALLGVLFGDGTWVILVAIVIAIVLAWALRMTAGTANQVAISAMLVLALGATTPGYAGDRILETLIGAAFGFVVNVLIVPPVAVAPAREAVQRLGDELAASVDRLAAALGTAQTPAQLQELLLTARLMRPMRDVAETAIAAGGESLTLNPRGRRHRDELAAVQERLDRIGPIVTQVIGMTRAFTDHYESSVADDPAVTAIAVQLRRPAHDQRLPALPDEAEETTTDPALTAPLIVAAPPVHWVLVGALLEDLRRIHESLGEAA